MYCMYSGVSTCVQGREVNLFLSAKSEAGGKNHASRYCHSKLSVPSGQI
jgi:hypothetical protein